MANTKVTGDVIANGTISTVHLADNAITSDKITGITTAHITEGSNLYYTDTRVRAAISVNGNALSYDSSTGVITSNYEESPTFTGDVTISQPVNGSDAILNLTSKSGAGNSRTSSIEYDADNEYMYFKNVGTTAATMTSGGNVGIGTTSPTANYPLTLRSKVGDYTKILDWGTDVGGSWGTLQISLSAPYATELRSGAWNFAQGNVGIGTTTPGQKLEVIGNISSGLSSTTTRTALIANTFGYSTSWKTLTLGSAGTNYQTDAVSLCFNVLLNQNSSGLYSGDGSEYFWRNTGSFKTPNSGNNGYNTILSWNSSGQPYFSNNVGIGTTSPGYTFTVFKSITNDWLALFGNTYNGAGNGVLIDAGNGSSGEILRLRDKDGNSKVSFLSNGNVGIGTTSPATKLHVMGTIKLGGYSFIGEDLSDLDSLTIASDHTESIHFAHYNSSTGTYTTNMIIDNSGNVGIGTTSPGAKLDVAGTVNIQNTLNVGLNQTSGSTNVAIRNYDGGLVTAGSKQVEFLLSGRYWSGGTSQLNFARINLYSENGDGYGYGGALGFDTGDGSEKMRITSGGRVEVAGNVLSIDTVDEYREDFTTTGASTPSFDIDLKSIGASGQPFEVFVAWTHYSTAYGAGLHQAYYQRSTVQSDITLIHTYFNQTSSNGGAWSVVWLTGTEIRVQKSSGTHSSSGYGYIRVTRLKP
jgi:hypothetical protein